ncbi:MAG: YdcF family protein [Oscillospiraceae bacterium]|nr:YdcF family protein [Oscillospiraceae bacterium]
MLAIKICKILRKSILSLIIIGFIIAIVAFSINGHVVLSTKKQIISPSEAAAKNADCVLILGCGILSSGQPSAMLSDRLAQGVALYKDGAAPKLLMSGDHGQKDYDEVNVMKNYALGQGVPSEDVFMDHAGFSTYESIYRAKSIFQAKKVIIVTQKYHLHRALYIANALGLEAYGVASDPRAYAGQTYRDVREILARNKDFFASIIKPAPTYGGNPIPVYGDGNLTNG